MGLTEARRRFDKTRGTARVLVSDHAWRDHPERGFTVPEIVSLIRHAPGQLRDNQAPSAQAGSFLFRCKDKADRPCELIVKFETDMKTGEVIVVVSAYRRVR